MKNVMVDLETWSLKPNATIVSIGAVKFDSETPVSNESEAFHVGVIPASQPQPVFDIDPGTVGWWMDPARDEARKAWLGLEKTDIASALTAFIMWLNPATPDEYAVWGNGAAFDNVILSHAFEKVTGPGTRPWGYRGDKCYKTMRGLLPGTDLMPQEQFGVPHTALADAMWQARHLQLIMDALGLTL